jgi:hypothetical protein
MGAVSFLKDDRNALYHHVDKKMRVAALLVAVFPITIGIVGIVSPDSLANARLHLMQTAGALYITGPVRVAMGLVLILFSPKSRMPKMLRIVGVIMALQGIVPLFIGVERGRAILEQQERMGTVARLAGALIALATGAFIAFTATPRRVTPSGGI